MKRVYMEQCLSDDSQNYPIMNQLFSAEDEVRKQLTRFLQQHRINHLDLLEILVQKKQKEQTFFRAKMGISPAKNIR